MSCPSKPMMDTVAAALPANGTALSIGAIHERVGMWAPVTVRHALRALVDEGRARAIGPAGARRRYAREEAA